MSEGKMDVGAGLSTKVTTCNRCSNRIVGYKYKKYGKRTLRLCEDCKSHLNRAIEETIDQNVGFTQIVPLVRQMFQKLGLDLEDENLRGTPQRFARTYAELLSGLKMVDKDVEVLFRSSFTANHNEMVAVSGIKCYSMCPHHFLPVLLNVSVGYIPDGKVLGLSKLPRYVTLLAKKPTLQEVFTHEIAEGLMKYLKPSGVGVVVHGLHLCMSIRGVKSGSAITTTSGMRGIFLKEQGVREEFLKLTGKPEVI